LNGKRANTLIRSTLGELLRFPGNPLEALRSERRISRWEYEAVLEKVLDRLDHNPAEMGVRRQTGEHPFGTIKCWMATEMALNVLACKTKRAMAIAGVGGLLQPMLA
jgi:transposase